MMNKRKALIASFAVAGLMFLAKMGKDAIEGPTEKEMEEMQKRIQQEFHNSEVSSALWTDPPKPEKDFH